MLTPIPRQRGDLERIDNRSALLLTSESKVHRIAVDLGLRCSEGDSTVCSFASTVGLKSL